MIKLNLGQIVEEDGEKKYKGNIDFKNGEKVYLIKQGELEHALERIYEVFKGNGTVMHDTLRMTLPDWLKMQVGNEVVEYTLDQHLYSGDYSKEFWLRYATIHQQIEEEIN